MMEQANRILTVLEEAGYEAYIIGGAVRDILSTKSLMTLIL